MRASFICMLWLEPSVYQAWASGNGHHMQGHDGVEVVPLGFDTYWYDVDRFRLVCNGMFWAALLTFSANAAYMCQVNACDSDNYCDDSMDDGQ